ncbi:hypothetical protein [Streptomyces sp. NPDC060031]|uniref:hypothetical protein n=1 Tax=Streptomyces sp. NPDC060031 TaxID=3347043 RepID=UPI003694452A
MAHIIAASPQGPRASDYIEGEVLAQEDNLVLLCLVCHKIIDSEDSAYPPELLHGWKRLHSSRISDAFDARPLSDRVEARGAIERYLQSNRATFDGFGPNSETAGDPFSDAAEIWKVRVREVIIPNNRMILRIVDANSTLLRPDEVVTVERFRIHVEEFERRHVFDMPSTAVPQFPIGMNELLCEGII